MNIPRKRNIRPFAKGAIEEAQKFLSGKKQELVKRIESKAILESYDDLPFWDYMMLEV